MIGLLYACDAHSDINLHEGGKEDPFGMKMSDVFSLSSSDLEVIRHDRELNQAQ